ncbi:hypothetical protein ACFV3R_34610 [Streptomyces sp. NPDC059740]|uniref:hypothetical protein n=1 Tax=Streptomyces sp. NPDC059740 TaxID=3346926 RepID=UPI003657819A
MDSSVMQVLRGHLLNIRTTSSVKVTVDYDQAIRLSLLLGYYEGAWSAPDIASVFEYWHALPEVLSESVGWIFTIRDFEPSWIYERENGDFTSVHVVGGVDRLYYQVVASRRGGEKQTLCRDINALRDAIR